MKLSLQILDRGETFYRSLEDAALLVGSADDADVRLVEDGVDPHHVRIEPLADGSFRLVDLGSSGGTRVNGDDVAQCRLAVGDRIEIGAAVLVVGQQLRRPATADDVLADDAATRMLSSGVAAARARRLRDETRSGPPRAVILGAVGAVLAMAALWLWSGSYDGLPPRWGEFQRAIREGHVPQARELLAELESGWVDGDPERAARLEPERVELAALESAIDELRAEVAAASATTTRSEQRAELERRADRSGRSAAAARAVLPELDDIRLAASRRAVVDGVANDPGDAADPTADPAASSSDTPVGDGVPNASTDPSDPSNATSRVADGAAFVARVLAEVAEARDDGAFAEAMERLNEALATAPVEAVDALRAARVELRGDAVGAMQELLNTMRDTAATADAAAIDAALPRFGDAIARFPSERTFAALGREIESLERYRDRLRAAANVADGAAAGGGGASTADVAARLAEARQTERDGDFGLAASRFASLAEDLATEQPGYAALLAGNAAELRALDALGVWLDQAGVDRRPLHTDELDVAAWASSWDSKNAPAPVLLGAGVLAYRHRANEVAEGYLARALRLDRELAPRIDVLIARGRGESQYRDGYRLVDGAFVAEREIRAAERADQLERELATLLRARGERRDKGLEELFAKGPDELDALIVALRRQAETQVERLRTDSFERHHARLAELREALDGARTHALDLIYDTDRYFYPYKPPAVSPQRASEYGKVQAEVDERVAAVRELWEAKTPRRSLPRSLADTLERLDWVLAVLRDLGESTSTYDADAGWARALPRDEPLTLQNFAWTVEERRKLDHAVRIRSYNATLREGLSHAEWDIVDLTNRYREMLGRMPLVVNDMLMEAARGHAKEMNELGYFSHHSPTEGRRSPFDRMRLAGYHEAASENIALYSSADGAHNGWTHSSGHHRNLLSDGNTEFGVGQDGRKWVQNFGRGTSYRELPAFSER